MFKIDSLNFDPFKYLEKNFSKITKMLIILGICIITVQLLLGIPAVNRVLVLITRLEGR
ncbi:hypothetical protein HYG86_01540 [Alkalicella caledoniensis]|uniref:Uncharacterized protein n=1 Tax=Alkalicella caledoniensis TaxID=2731377 RepID=A0A7G9W4C9_ALKCA|nr:hypothetical protein [Alkalicella caledoniensis]QNO13541.1 hypothetical protein HYG86_01540 [Alkalicella caledoniensis]